MKLTAEQRIEKAHVQLMQDPDFCLFSGVFMVGKVEISEVIPTACTNGRDVIYGRAFVDGLNDKELNFLVLHEAMHKAYRHIQVWQKLAKEDVMVTNMATDYVINLQLHDYDKPHIIQMPKKDGKLMGLLDERFRGMDTKQVYDTLKQEGQGGDGEGQGDGESSCLDDHDWENAADMPEKEKQELEQEIDRALREGAILAGRMKGKMPRGIDDLLHPKIDWKEALREFVKSTTMGRDNSSWRRPNRRYIGRDIVMPTVYSEKVGTIAVGIDTSGSIVGEVLGQFLGEVKAICDEVCPEAIELMYWDSHVAKYERYAGHEVSSLVTSTKPAGGGGTEPACVPKFMVDKNIEPECVVMLTDGCFYGGGCGDWSGVSAPVLWCVKGNTRFVATVGKTVYIGE